MVCSYSIHCYTNIYFNLKSTYTNLHHAAGWFLFTITGSTRLYISETALGHVLLDFTAVTSKSVGVATHDVSQFYNVTLHVTVKCTNGAGLTSTSVTDGVRLLKSPPRSDHVVLDVLTSSLTQYPARGMYHGDPTHIRFRWKDFNIYQNISSYNVCNKMFSWIIMIKPNFLWKNLGCL